MREFVSAFVGYAHDWQTLLSGLLAIVAALIGAIFLHRQTRQSDQHEQRRLERRLSAIRATLPLTLSGIGKFAHDATRQLSALRNALQQNHVGPMPPGFDPPQAPSGLVSELREIIETTDDHRIINLVFDIISEIQILESRMKSLLDANYMARMVGTAMNIDQYLIQSARLSAMIEALYDFARRQADTGPSEVHWDGALAVLRMNGMDQTNNPELFEALEKRQKRMPEAWVFCPK